MGAQYTGCQVGSFVFLLMSVTGFLAAFSATYWMEHDGKTYGLWKACSGDICTSMVGTDITTVGIVLAQAMYCVALVMCMVSVGAHLAWVMLSLEVTCVIAWGSQATAAFLSGMATIVWGNEIFKYFGYDVLSWCFWLMLASSLLMALSSGITACKTSCGTRLERKRLFYSATAATRGVSAYPAGGHDLSDYSDMTQSDYDLPMPTQTRLQPGWSGMPARKY